MKTVGTPVIEVPFRLYSKFEQLLLNGDLDEPEGVTVGAATRTRLSAEEIQRIHDRSKKDRDGS